MALLRAYVRSFDPATPERVVAGIAHAIILSTIVWLATFNLGLLFYLR